MNTQSFKVFFKKQKNTNLSRLITPQNLVVFFTAALLGRTHLAFGAYPFAIALVGALPARVFVGLAGAILGALTLGKDGILYCMLPLIVIFVRIIISGADREEGTLFTESLPLRASGSVVGGFVGALYELLLFGITTESVLYSLCMILGTGALTLIYGMLFFYPITLQSFLRDDTSLVHRGGTRGERAERSVFQISLLAYALSVTYALRPYSLLGISAAYLALTPAVLFVALRFGSLRAMALGFLCALPLSPYSSVAFALMGALGGVLFPVGVAIAEVSCVLAVAVWCAYAQGVGGLLSLLPEVMLGAIIFLPLSTRMESANPKTENEADIKSRTAEMIGTLAMSLRCREENVSVRLEQSLCALVPLLESQRSADGMPDTSVYRRLVEQTASMRCKTCPHFSECDGNTTAFFCSLPHICEVLAAHRLPTEDDVGSCANQNPEEFLGALNAGAARLEEEGYAKERADGTPELISRLASFMQQARRQSEEDGASNPTLSDRAQAAIRAGGFPEGSARVLGERRPRVLFCAEDKDGTRITDPALLSRLSEAVGAPLGEPSYYRKEDYVLADARCRPKYKVSCATATLAHGSDGISGDVGETFEGRDGVFYGLLSDGVGSGAVAKRRARFCADFLRTTVDTGAEQKCALYLLDEIAGRRGEEFATTVDLFCLDLYLGEAQFYKIGAVSSFIKRGDSLFRIRSDTTPLGFGEGMLAERIRAEVLPGDLVILFSDGVLDTPDSAPWLLEYLSRRERRDLSAYAEEILSTAKMHKEQTDDMSVLICRVEIA